MDSTAERTDCGRSAHPMRARGFGLASETGNGAGMLGLDSTDCGLTQTRSAASPHSSAWT